MGSTPGLTRRQRTLRARLGALELHAQYDAKATTAAARQAFLRTFEGRVDPEGLLGPEERARRAEFARKAHFTRLSLMSSMARNKGTASDSPAPTVPEVDDGPTIAAPLRV